MNLKNGYKVMYEVIDGSERVFSASTTGCFADREEIARFDIGTYKVVYQRGDSIFGIDAEGAETELTAFKKVFEEGFVEENTQVEDLAPASYSRKRSKIVEPVEEPEVPAEPVVTEEV